MAKESSSTASPANKADGNLISNPDGNGLNFMGGQARESGAPGDAVGVDKIRDLLFGNQMQDYDRRFSKLEERVLQRFKDVESEAKRNLEMYRVKCKEAGRLACRAIAERKRRASRRRQGD